MFKEKTQNLSFFALKIQEEGSNFENFSPAAPAGTADITPFQL